MDAGYCSKLQDDRNTTRQCNEAVEADDWDWPFDEEEKDCPEAEYRLLKKDETLQDGDEVYVGFGDWMTLYIPDWIKQEVNDGTYRRKLITDCDLKDEVADCDLKEECKCGRRYIYHWLYGWICEDCDLKLSDYYP